MTILNSEGFDRLVTYADVQRVCPGTIMPNATLHTDTPFARGKAIKAPAAPGNSANQGILITPRGTGNTRGIAFHCRCNALPGTNANRGALLTFYEGSTGHVTIRVSLTGELIIMRGDVSTTTTLYSTGVNIPVGPWFHVEVKVFVADSGGYVYIRINRVQVAAFVNGDTRNGGVGTINGIGLGPKNNAATTGDYDFDNVVVWNVSGDVNNDFLGDVEVIELMPTADDAAADWTLSAGADGYALINGAADGDDTYIASDVVDALSQFEVESLPAGFNRVYAVEPFALVKKDDSGDRTISLGVASGAEVSDSTGKELPLDYEERSEVIELDPDTGFNWEVEAVNDLKLRLKVAS